MSFAMDEQLQDPHGAMSANPLTSAEPFGHAQSYRIARSGRRPLRFSGSELAMAMSFTPELPYWYEINLYRLAEGGFAVAVRLFHQSEDRSDTVEAEEFASLDDALDWIEAYDAANDVLLEMGPEAADSAPADLAVRSLELRSRIAAARQHYAGLVGEFLYDLEAA